MFDLFTPTSDTVTASATTTTSNVALGAFTSIAGGSVRVANIAAGGTVFIKFGDATVTATTAAGMPVFAGAVETFQLGPKDTYAAVITGLGTSTVYFTVGQGA